jgi:hypothetical protein
VVDEDLILCSHKIDLRDDIKIGNWVGVVIDITNGVAVGDGPGVECSVTYAGKPDVAFGRKSRNSRSEGRCRPAILRRTWFWR